MSTALYQREDDVGSYLYIDNFARAVRRTGNIINDLIPHIYDIEHTKKYRGYRTPSRHEPGTIP
jgi:hypothetical protein